MFWWVLCTATFCALPLTIWEFKNQGWSPHYQGKPFDPSTSSEQNDLGMLTGCHGAGCAAWFIGGIFVILTIPIAVYEVRTLLCPNSGFYIRN